MLNYNVCKIKLYYYGAFQVIFFFLLLHFKCNVYGVEVSIRNNTDYLLNTGDVAKFQCAAEGTVHPLKYFQNGTAINDTSITIQINKTDNPDTWQCTKDYGESAVNSQKIQHEDNKAYALSIDHFNCTGKNEPTLTYILCQIPNGSIPSSNNICSTMLSTQTKNVLYVLSAIFTISFFLA